MTRKFLQSLGVVFFLLIVTACNALFPAAPTPQLTAASSPPGSSTYRIAFASDRGQPSFFNIYTMNVDGSNVTRLTNIRAIEKSAAWSPDGKRIAFGSDRDGHYEIYVMNADGSNVVRLTNTPALSRQPTWSPDGKSIAFSSEMDGNWEIYIVPSSGAANVPANSDASAIVRLTNVSAYDWEPAWSPDGKSIAFTSNRYGGNQIFRMDTDGSHVRQLTTDDYDNSMAAWSPDSQRIAYISIRNGTWDIYVMNSDGSNIQRLTKSNAISRRPAWSPDGRLIVFEREGNIYSMNADGSNVTNLTKHPTSDTSSVCLCSLR